MDLLIDTGILIWILADSSHLTINSKQIVQTTDKRFISSISIAEIEIKRSIGKLTIPDTYLQKIFESGFEELPFEFSDAYFLGKLPFFHKDPFDRMLISHAIVKGLTLLTNDKIFKKYNLPIILNE
ncbi:MAG TPA: type II toxin-antitoxin system VapC family toxin [bacterium]|nr:type II toxin-antitoxin system VapC family toxin [bacterium]